jgi:hypothetical protein
MSGKFGVKGGCMRAQNNQAGTVSVTTDDSGNGSGSATFRQSMKGIPTVVTSFYGATSANAQSAGIITAVERTTSGFKAVVKGATTHSGTVTISYHAFDDAYR